MKKTLLTSAICITVICSYCQDIHFSQYNYSALTLNPALTAAYKDLQATLQYKDQWHNLNGYRTMAATFEMKADQRRWIEHATMSRTYKKKMMKGMAFGLQLFSDKAGDGALKQTQLNMSMAYHAHISEGNTFSAALIGGVVQHSITSMENLRWNSQYYGGLYDPSMPSEDFSNRSFTNPDFGMGILWSHGEPNRYLTANDQKHFNLGVSIAHLNRPKYSFISETERLNMKMTMHGNTMYGIANSPLSTGFSFFYTKQGKTDELTLGGQMKYKFKEESQYTGFVKGASLSLGCYYRNKDAVIPYLLIEMDAYAIGLSYDSNISGLKTATTGRGGFEVTLRLMNLSPFLYQTNSKI